LYGFDKLAKAVDSCITKVKITKEMRGKWTKPKKGKHSGKTNKLAMQLMLKHEIPTC